MRQARRAGWRVGTAFAAIGAAALLAGSAGARSTIVTYGVSVSKGCNQFTVIGQSETCTFVFGNNNPTTTSGDNVVLTQVMDTVSSAGGPTTPVNLLPGLSLVASGTGNVNCSGPSLTGLGTQSSPWKGAVKCNLQYGAVVSSQPYAVYQTTLADYGLASHRLNDQAAFHWTDKCNKTATPDTCESTADNTNQAAAGTTVTLITPTITTALSASSIAAGKSVHDTATITFDSQPAQVSGTVTYRLYTDNGCTALSTAPALNQQVGYTGGSVPSSQEVTFPNAGSFWFRATFSGDSADGVDGPVSSPCTSEPLTVNSVDANIQITPAAATNHVGSPHTLTGHVNVNDGTGFANAPAGTTINFGIVSGPGSFGGSSTASCATAGATGSCSTVLSSTTTGTTVVNASTSVTVMGVVLNRATNDGKAGDSANAQKSWINATIAISPTQTNPVGVPHTFTVTVEQDTGGGLAPAQGVHVDFTLTDRNDAGHTLDTALTTCGVAGGDTNAAGRCLIVFSSPSAGTVTGHATATLTFNGQSFPVATDGVGGDSLDAVKTYVDANLSITPQNAANPVGSPHTLTATVQVDAGDGNGYVNAPAGTPVTFSIVSGPGSFAGNPTATCTTVGTTGACNVVLSSSMTGITRIHGTATVTVGGLQLTRSTGDTNAGDGADATKTWRNVTVLTSVLDASGTDVTGSHIPFGSVVHDKVTVTGVPSGGPTPAGSVVFTLYQSPACGPGSGVVGAPQTVALGADGTAVTPPTAALPPGSYGFRAEFQGDVPDSFPDVTGACEPFTVNPIPPCVLGYPDGSNPPRSSTVFNESSVLVSAGLFGTGSNQHVGVFYSDEHALTLGVEPGVTPYPGFVPPNGLAKPGVGDTAATDGAGRPIFPAMFVTDITSSPNSRSGDWQQAADNGGATAPTLLFGTWKDATGSGSAVTPGADPAANPNWQLGSGADTPPSSASPQQYTSEVVWNTEALGLIPGHAYRLQVMVHDGDQNHQGGDVGEACVNVVIPSSPPPPDANISISPSAASNPVGTNHTLTAQVQVNSGSGLVNAPAGTTVAFSIPSGPGSFVGGVSSCSTVGTTGACTVAITSTSAGMSDVRAATDVTVLGKSLHRETGDSNAGDSSDAVKAWIACSRQTPCPPGATIAITPVTATSRVGTTQGLTATVLVDQGTGQGPQPAQNGVHVTFSIVSGPGSFAGSNTCATGGRTGACSVAITSASAGTTVVRAAADVPVGSGASQVTLHRETGDPSPGDGGDANRTWTP